MLGPVSLIFIAEICPDTVHVRSLLLGGMPEPGACRAGSWGGVMGMRCRKQRLTGPHTSPVVYWTPKDQLELL